MSPDEFSLSVTRARRKSSWSTQLSLVWCFRNPLNNLGVIPGKLAIPPQADQPQAEASATRNPGKSKASGFPLSRV